MNNGIKSLLGSFAMSAVVLGAATVFAQDVTFAYKFEPGSSERHRVKLNQEVTMGTMAVSNLADMEVTVKCVSGANGKYAMEIKFDKVDVGMTMMGQTSASPIGDQLVGQSIAFTADGNGEVTEVKPVGVFDAWATAQTLVEPVLEGWYPHLPGNAVKVGGGWKKAGEKKPSSSGVDTQINAAYTFKAMKKEKGRDLAVVDQALDAVVSGKTAMPMGTFLVAGTGKGKGEFLYEPAKGRVVKVKGKIDISMDMTPEDGGDTMETVVINHVERDLLD